MTKPYKIALTNQKGGLGKTTISVFMSYFLSQEKDKKILFLDLDVQGNSSFCLNKYDSGVSVVDFLTKQLPDQQLENIKECANLGICLLHSSPELADDYLFTPEKVLNVFNINFDKLSSEFDFVIIDTPPTLGNMLFVSLLLSNRVMIPVETDAFSPLGLGNMLKVISEINMHRAAEDEIKILGIVINKFLNNKRQKSVLASYRQEFNDLLFNTQIRCKDCIAEALTEQLTFKELTKKKGHYLRSIANASFDFKSLSLEVLKRLDK